MRKLLRTLAALTASVLLIGHLLFGSDVSHLPIGSRGSLRVGWEAYFPYQMTVDGQYTGLDTELLRAAASRIGYRLELVPQDFATSLAQVEEGELDGLSLAFQEPERLKYAAFTRPYLALRSAVFFRLDRRRSAPNALFELQNLIEGERLRLGRARGYAYPEPLARILDRAQADNRVREAPLEANCLNDLADNRVDLVFADELSGLSLVRRQGWSRTIGCAVLELPARPVHLLLSKKSVPPELVAQLDAAIGEMEKSGETASIVRAYYYPTLLNLLARDFLFGQIAVLATAAAAVSGLFLARKGGFNLIGAFLLAAAPAAGGGLLRDLLAGRHPIALVADHSILLTILVMVLVSSLLWSLFPDWLQGDHQPLLIFLDSLGLAAFTVIGVVVAMQTRCEPLWLWGPLLAAVTNGGGALLRDLIAHHPPRLVRPGPMYLEIPLGWGLALSLFLVFYSAYPVPKVFHLQLAVGLTLLGIVATRYLALRLGWQSLSF